MSERPVQLCKHGYVEDCGECHKCEQEDPVAPEAFVSDATLPSCHICGSIMVGVCPKCGASTNVEPAAPIGPPAPQARIAALERALEEAVRAALDGKGSTL